MDSFEKITNVTELLKAVCEKHSVKHTDIMELVEIEKSYIGKSRRRGMNQKFDDVMQSIVDRKEGVKNAVENSEV